MAPQIPHPVSGTIYDEKGEAYSGAIVIVYNLTNQTSIETTSKANGGYIIDLANITTKDYSDGDIILVRAYLDGCYRRFGENRNTVDTGAGQTDQDVTMVIANPPLPFELRLDRLDLMEHNTAYNSKQVVNILQVDPEAIDLVNNPDFAYTYDGSGRITQMDVTIKGVTYRRTITYEGSNWQPATRTKWVRQ